MSWLRKVSTQTLHNMWKSSISYPRVIPQVRLMSSKAEETEAEFDARYEAFFNRPDIDGWEVSLNHQNSVLPKNLLFHVMC